MATFGRHRSKGRACTAFVYGVQFVIDQKGDTVQVAWLNNDQESVTRLNGKKIARSGSTTRTPHATTVYKYQFRSSEQKLTCAVKVHVVTARFSNATTTSWSSKPTIKGTVSELKHISVQIYKYGSSTAFYTSKIIPVKKGVWKTKISKKLPDGTYRVVLTGTQKFKESIIAQEVFNVGRVTVREVEKSQTTIVVIPVPLLSGGTVRSGESVSVSFLQVINIGKEPVRISGFYVKQNGSASLSSLDALTVADDLSTAYGTTESGEGTIVSTDRGIRVPIEISILPSDMRLFTIKAVLQENLWSSLGTQLKLDVGSVETSAKVQGTFPIRGTTWTISE